MHQFYKTKNFKIKKKILLKEINNENLMFIIEINCYQHKYKENNYNQ